MLYRAKRNGDEGVLKCKNIGDETPVGYEKTNLFFVDNSGMGTRGEPALVMQDFLSKIKEGYFYGITSAGQFQVYIGEFKKLKITRKELYQLHDIKKSKLVRRNTRLTEYNDGRRVLRLHQTDVLTYKPDGKILLNSGGWRTHTTKERLNSFLPVHIRVYQKNYSWYVRQEGKKDIEFTDGMEIQG